jgi:hypothetical protein
MEVNSSHTKLSGHVGHSLMTYQAIFFNIYIHIYTYGLAKEPGYIEETGKVRLTVGKASGIILNYNNAARRSTYCSENQWPFYCITKSESLSHFCNAF